MIEKLYCPECGSEEVFSTHEQAFMVNTGDHYCHMVKDYDSNAKAGCTKCDWRGERSQLAAHRIKGDA